MGLLSFFFFERKLSLSSYVHSSELLLDGDGSGTLPIYSQATVLPFSLHRLRSLDAFHISVVGMELWASIEKDSRTAFEDCIRSNNLVY